MEQIDWRPDRVNSVSSATGRLVHAGTRAAQVLPTATSKTQISALLDLVDLHLSRVDCGEAVDPDRVVLRIPTLTSEARGALGTLIAAMDSDGPAVEVLDSDGDDGWTSAAVGWNIADDSEYPRWPGLLAADRPVPTLVTEIVEQASAEELRAYPMLSTKSGWSLRVEGLEVGRADAEKILLNVGRQGKVGGQSSQRSAWIAATGSGSPVATGSATDAAALISKFVKDWRALGSVVVDQNEHALESRILRGQTPITAAGNALSLIKPDGVVNWGSQYPTKWGPGGQARYLDALLRDGSTPWAIEMKVQGPGGVGQYYRHAVAQAVLYREFIRQAEPLYPWFEDQDMNAKHCQAAVVVPAIPARQVSWRGRLQRLCEVFSVAFIEVDPSHARKH